MKTKLFITLLVTVNAAFSQISLVNSFSNVSSIGKYHENNETFYFSETGNVNQIQIFDHDFNLSKTVNFTTPAGHKDAQFYVLDRPFFVTKNIFSKDNKFVFPVFFNSNNSSTTKLQLINEDGIVVKDFGTSSYSYYTFEVFFDEKTNSNKLLLHNQTSGSIEVYDLPDGDSLSIQSYSKQNQIKVFPNPTNNKFTIVDSRKTIGKGLVYDSSGKIVKEFSMDKSSIEKEIDLSSNDRGIYLIKAGNTTTKIIKE